MNTEELNSRESTPSQTESETRLQKYIRVAWRWVLVALLALGLGMLIIVFALYIPTWQKLKKANTNLEGANASITSATNQIAMLQLDIETLQMNLDSTTLHMDVLKALSGVRGASLAVADDDYAGARLSLIQATDTLDSLTGRLGTEQQDVLGAMQQGATQALADIQTDLKSAQPELDQLTQNLVQLEENLFPSP